MPQTIKKPKKSKTPTVTVQLSVIHFEDHGQDFLLWHVNDEGVVVKSEPFQTGVWKGAKITNFKTLKVGDKVDITHMHKNTSIKYPITKIEKP